MSIVEKKPALKETVGAQYVCFNTPNEEGEWTEEFEPEVEKTKVVKSVKVTEETDNVDEYASGEIYDSNNKVNKVSIEVEVIAFPDATIAKMKGDLVDKGGLILSGGNRIKPYFAYGKVVKFKGGKVRYDWYPKCKLVENTDQADTSEEKYKGQTDTIKIVAYPYNEDGDVVAKVSSDMNMPAGLTEDKYFSKPMLTPDDLASVVSGS